MLSTAPRPEGRENRIYWLCRCDCGTERIITKRSVVSGHSKSCGCWDIEATKKRNALIKAIDLSNQKFGRVTILRELSREKYGIRWEFKCECGNIGTAIGTELRRGNVRSCGCLVIDTIRNTNRKGKGHSGFRRLLAQYRYRAKKDEILFELTEEEFRDLTQQKCHYCGSAPSQVSINSGIFTEEGKIYSTYIYNGIDRKSPKLGYIKSNCVACCGECNYRKLDWEYEEFKSWVNKVYFYFIN